MRHKTTTNIIEGEVAEVAAAGKAGGGDGDGGWLGSGGEWLEETVRVSKP